MTKKLDSTDFKLLSELDTNCRQSFPQLARKLRVSKELLRYRIENLEKRKIISGYYTLLDCYKIGYIICPIYLKFQNTTLDIEKEITNYLKKQKKVGLCIAINGKWDLVFGIWAKNVVELRKTYDQIMAPYEKHILEKTVTLETDCTYFNSKLLKKQTKNSTKWMCGGDLVSNDLDEIGKVILSILSSNARISLVDISKQVGITAVAVNNRIKKLLQKEVILAFRALIDFKKLGYSQYRIFFHLVNLTNDTIKKLTSALGQYHNVVSVSRTVGYADLECRVYIESIEELYALLNKIRDQFPNILREFTTIRYYKAFELLNFYPL